MKEAYLCRLHYTVHINYILGLIILIVVSIATSNHSHLPRWSQQRIGVNSVPVSLKSHQPLLFVCYFVCHPVVKKKTFPADTTNCNEYKNRMV